MMEKFLCMSYHVEFDVDLKRNAYSGRLIVLEGIDGSGKTTQVHSVVDALNKKGIKAVFTKEPTNSVVGVLLKDVLSGKLKLPPVSFQYLFAADRAVHQEEIIKYLKKGITVVSDRYLWSALIYGMLDIDALDNKNDKERLMIAYSILSMYHRFLVPDFTFYLGVSTKVAMRRIAQKTQKIEIYEKEEKIEKLRKGYDWLAKKFNKEIAVIDGGRPVGVVTEEIISKIK